MIYTNELKQDNTVQFLAHEIRNPLTAINMAVDIIRKQLPSGSLLSDTANQMISVISRNTAHIETLMKKLLAYNSSPSSEMGLLNITDILQCCLEKITDRLVLKNIELEQHLNSSLLIKGVHDQLGLAFINIIINAIEAVEEGNGKIWLHAFDVNNKVVVIIKDNGQGMDEEFCERIFEQKISGKTKGLGLGMHHVKEILDFHSAEITLKSKCGKGTSFQIVLHNYTNAND